MNSFFYFLDKRFGCLLLLFLLISSLAAQGQFFRQDRFGKNRVQYKQFDWRVISTANFDIYYYDGGYEAAKLAANYAESDFGRITDLVGFSPYNKTKLFIYNSIIDLQQSNIGVNHQGFEIGGQTNFVRSEVEIAFTSQKSTFRKELALGIADILIFEMMYGGNLKEILQSNYLLNLPEWFMAGAARYIAFGWSEEMDNYMRDMLTNRKFKRPERLTGEEAKLAGHSIWNYLAEEYGRANIANVLNLTRIVRNEETSVRQSLGITYDIFIQGWKEYYLKQLANLGEDHANLLEEEVFLSADRGQIINKIKLSPDGRYLAFTENQMGRYKISVTDLRKNKTQVLMKGGYKVLSQKVDYNIPLIDWRSENELAVFAPVNSKNYFFLLDIDKNGKKVLKREFPDFVQINSFAVSPDGRQLVISAYKGSNTDLFLHDISRRRTSQLTNDEADDVDPRFMRNANRIVFSSNRINDTLSVKANLDFLASDNYNIFLYDPASKEVLQRITNTLSTDVLPIPINNNDILFISDQRGIRHIYRHSLSDSVYNQISNYKLDILEYDYYDGNLYTVAFQGGSQQIYKTVDFDPKRNAFTNKTYRQQVLDLRSLQKMKREREQAAAEEQRKADAELRQQNELPNKDKDPDEAQEEPTENTSETIDTDNYQFDTFSRGKRQSFLDRFRAKDDEEVDDVVGQQIRISRPSPYESRFTADNFVTSLLIDPLRSSLNSGGWGLLFEVAMTDVLENHKINAGVFFQTSLSNSNFFAEYEYLKHRIDFRAFYERQSLAVNTEVYSHEYNMNILQASASYPFNITTRATFSPFLATTRYTNTTLSNLNQSDRNVQYGGFKAELVFDNSIVTGMNMMEGTRAKISFEQYYDASGTGRHFGNFMLDARHYQKIYRSLIFATRFAYGQFTGRAKKNYLLGGMDNWVFNRTDAAAPGEPLDISNGNADMSDLLFTRFVTNLRGFNYNKWSGNNFMLLNAELRFPLVKFFYRGTISSNFFRNLQLVAFTDVGSSWTGLSPFNRENALNTVEGSSGGFSWKVSNFKNPFLVGYGFGARTMLLGYYMKFDVAWGIEDQEQVDNRFYLTLGHDF